MSDFVDDCRAMHAHERAKRASSLAAADERQREVAAVAAGAGYTMTVYNDGLHWRFTRSKPTSASLDYWPSTGKVMRPRCRARHVSRSDWAVIALVSFIAGAILCVAIYKHEMISRADRARCRVACSPNEGLLDKGLDVCVCDLAKRVAQ